MGEKKSAYAAAGVDIDEMADALARVKRMVKRTAVPGVLGEVGAFGGLFRSPGRDQVLVASTDGVGTKLKVAHMAGRHDTVGQDLVNHCVNDILVQGASPLFFLDYLGAARLKGNVFRDVVRGICLACRRNECALLGGETAEMPGLYPPEEYDLVGTIVGAVPQKQIVNGSSVRVGDRLIGLPSGGLQTNGYSLARQILFEQEGLGIHDVFPGSKQTVAQALLRVHASFLHPVQRVLRNVRVRGMAHITGGGLVDNVPRALPDGLCATINRSAWRPPRVFRFLQERGNVDGEEMFRVFNMGIGFVLIVRERDVAQTLGVLRKSRVRPVVIGKVFAGKNDVVFEG